MKILIADDHQIIRYGLKLVLKNIWPDAIILEAEDLDAAVFLISNNEIGLMVLDMNMQGSEKLEELIFFVVNETRVVIFSGYDHESAKVDRLINACPEIFTLKNLSIEEVEELFSSLHIHKF